MYQIELAEKYTILMSEDAKVFKVLRYNQEWKDLHGDKLTYLLIEKLRSLEEKYETTLAKERTKLYNLKTDLSNLIQHPMYIDRADMVLDNLIKEIKKLIK